LAPASSFSKETTRNRLAMGRSGLASDSDVKSFLVGDAVKLASGASAELQLLQR
jgi:hypothetical protein